ncbi:TraR/DksA C4-type zinc finger protein [Paraliobacillus zengyii]|uniref:TraR/DksA C4-type zinc finger protein n=1 Tax=Paraliobacillus zengyii TaxID=2213194 RepID=UPI000DD362A2|nr:TraR/DksA C4-type zinc finger protein [Paraliobacillus zengyii]
MVTSELKDYSKTVLLKEKKQVIDQMKMQENQEDGYVNQVIEELSNYDNHPGDQGSELFEREKNIALNEHTIQELRDINDALHAINDDSYGFCKTCGKEINEERLQAMPTALHCIKHATVNEDIDYNHRPIEEDLLNPNVTQEDNSKAFDGQDTWEAVEEHGSSDTASDFYQKEYINQDERNSKDIENFAKTDITGENKRNN